MAALSMVIIAAVIGGFNDIGWEVLLTMRKAQFGQALLAGLVIVIFAIVIDRMSGVLAVTPRPRQRPARCMGHPGRSGRHVGAVAVSAIAADANTLTLFDPVLAESVDDGVGAFTANNGAALDSLKNGAMFYGLLPLRSGWTMPCCPSHGGSLDTAMHSAILLCSVAAAIGALLAMRGRRGWFWASSC